mgnify:CR=1 FL=1
MEREIAKGLLSIGAVFLRPEQPFTWASGIKSPIYCDNRLILTAPEVRKKVEAAIAETVKAKFPACEVLMGTSTAGIAHAAIAATILDLPMGYVRSGSKDHGRGNQIEGKLEKGEKVVVIEDLISTGGSAARKGFLIFDVISPATRVQSVPKTRSDQPHTLIKLDKKQPIVSPATEKGNREGRMVMASAMRNWIP